MEGSEFKENEDSNKLGLVSGLNGKSNQWSFEGLIDINGHSNSRPLIETEERHQVSVNCDSGLDGPRVTFEENSLHSNAQPLEALSGEDSAAPPCSFHGVMSVDDLCPSVMFQRCDPTADTEKPL